MSSPESTQSSSPKPSLDRSGVKRIVQVVSGTLLFAVVLFLSAGRLDWPMAWAYVSSWFVALLAMTVIDGGKNPGLINERGRKSANTKRWDKVLMAIYAPMPFIILAVAGLDAGRFGWSSMPFALQIVGLAMMVPAFIMPTWAMVTNPFLATTVRIQNDRGHHVITTGPYQVVRHPTYVGTILTWLSTPLILGSWWAMIPSGLCILLFVVRTALEDKTQREELPGYAEYAQRVRYRLLPGVW